MTRWVQALGSKYTDVFVFGAHVFIDQFAVAGVLCTLHDLQLDSLSLNLIHCSNVHFAL